MALVNLSASLSLTAANILLQGAEEAAISQKLKVVISVVDPGGVLKAFRRMDDAPLLSVDLATDKAYTAVSFGMPSHAWFDFIRDDPPLLHGIVKTPRLVVFGGGFPVVIDGVVVGGIGVSGGHYAQDMAIAEAGLQALEAEHRSGGGA